MSNVISLELHRAKKEQPKPVDLYARAMAKKTQTEQVVTGLNYMKGLPRGHFPDHEPPGAA